MTERHRNLDALRIFAILCITVHHLVINGIFNVDALSENQLPDQALLITYICSVINSFVVIGVNLFFLLSGYFSIKFSLKKIFYLIFSIMVVYTIMVIVNQIFYDKPFTIHQFNSCVMSLKRYWFINVYILLILVSPFLNRLVATMSAKTYAHFLAGILIVCCGYYAFFSKNDGGINDGYSLVSGMYLYILGGGINKWHIEKRISYRKLAVLAAVFFVCNAGMLYTNIYIRKNYEAAWNLFAYTNPCVFSLSLLCFLFFCKLSVPKRCNRWIDFFTPGILTVYIIQSSGIEIIKTHRAALITYGYEHFGAVPGLLCILPNAVLIVCAGCVFHVCIQFLCKRVLTKLSVLAEKVTYAVVTAIISIIRRILRTEVLP